MLLKIVSEFPKYYIKLDGVTKVIVRKAEKC